ncbi:MarR family winged helix-turn-helix transcriptional regulator [Glutamicibacter uratoxydans]|uniref:MarR family winged helix-turn-helix transcriptional regulator n=1 Tax=Glutamicibacter uratoxydans TaxID=43667 RepID=UPI003D6F2485
MESRQSFELVQLLQRFAQASDRYVESTGALHRTHRTDMNALSVILRYERERRLPSPSDLSRELHLSSPATTALLDRLERLGYVQRQRGDKDRRVVRIALTDQARLDGRAMFMPLAEQMMQLISDYTPEQVQLLHGFMVRAIEAVDAAREVSISTHDQEK